MHSYPWEEDSPANRKHCVTRADGYAHRYGVIHCVVKDKSSGRIITIQKRHFDIKTDELIYESKADGVVIAEKRFKDLMAKIRQVLDL
tara:strand:+ start:1767 stop:2030 length:264 start_codon:yes stop_codon:yes gene_type:complete